MSVIVWLETQDRGLLKSWSKHIELSNSLETHSTNSQHTHAHKYPFHIQYNSIPHLAHQFNSRPISGRYILQAPLSKQTNKAITYGPQNRPAEQFWPQIGLSVQALIAVLYRRGFHHLSCVCLETCLLEGPGVLIVFLEWCGSNSG